MKISSTLGAILIIIASVLLVYRIAGIKPIKQVIDKVVVKQARLILICLTAILLPIFLWNNIVSFVTLTEPPNAYVRWTSTPYPNLGIDNSAYILLVEFGADTTVIKNIDITLSTGNKYKVTPQWWFYSPHTIGRPSVFTIAPGIGSGDIEIDDRNPPLYIYKNTSDFVIPGTTSLYICFESDFPMTLKNVIFNGKAIDPAEGIIQP